MIARRDLTDDQRAFNARWGAPAGYDRLLRKVAARLARHVGSLSLQARALGPFGFQPDNNATRAAEYSWAYGCVPVGPGMLVVDLGGSLGGLQFVLARSGARVINVDPGEAAIMGWPVNSQTISTLNRAFGTTVELRKKFLKDAGLADESVDRLYCISTLEHVPASELPDLIKNIAAVLRPGGLAVLTVDLFFDLTPFTDRLSNRHGSNIDVRTLVETSGLTLVQGVKAELCGFPEFDPRAVLAQASEFCQGNIALNAAQTLVLRKDL